MIDGIRLEHLPYTPLRITSGFGPRNTGIPGATKNHQGVDIGTDKSKPYTSTDGGDVEAVLPGKISVSTYNSARGEYIKIDHGYISGHKVESLYQHLKKNTRGVIGQSINTGAVVGRMGNTGVGAQLHLHFELHIDGVPVDPEPYLKNIKEKDMTEADVKKIVKEVLAELGINDSAEAPKWATAWEMAKKDKVTDGTGPNKPGTRAQMMQFIYRALGKVDKLK